MGCIRNKNKLAHQLIFPLTCIYQCESHNNLGSWDIPQIKQCQMECIRNKNKLHINLSLQSLMMRKNTHDVKFIVERTYIYRHFSPFSAIMGTLIIRPGLEGRRGHRRGAAHAARASSVVRTTVPVAPSPRCPRPWPRAAVHAAIGTEVHGLAEWQHRVHLPSICTYFLRRNTTTPFTA
jgi:hypothetical protein